MASHYVFLRSKFPFIFRTDATQAYFVAWFFNFLTALFLLTIITLVVYPPSRSFLFPPAPLSLVSAKSGNLQNPKAGQLGSYTSLTGAPEKHQGEAIEQEAASFVSSFASITISAVAGRPRENDLRDKESGIDKSIPDPSNIISEVVEAKKTKDYTHARKHDRTKQPMEEAMWKQLRPIMHFIGNIADGWERFGKYFPTIHEKD
jgi:hypothetical protein